MMQEPVSITSIDDHPSAELVVVSILQGVAPKLKDNIQKYSSSFIIRECKLNHNEILSHSDGNSLYPKKKARNNKC